MDCALSCHCTFARAFPDAWNILLFLVSLLENLTDPLGTMPSISFIKLFFLFFNKFIYFYFYLFLAVLGLRCCMRAFSSCGERWLLFVAVRGLLIAVASLVAERVL